MPTSTKISTVFPTKTPTTTITRIADLLIVRNSIVPECGTCEWCDVDVFGEINQLCVYLIVFDKYTLSSQVATIQVLESSKIIPFQVGLM